jgi:hypothetical protein
MSTIGAHIRNGRLAWLARCTHAGQISPGAEPPPANTPYWVLWSTGIVAVVLCIVAFVLWGINGANTLFDMIVAFCT